LTARDGSVDVIEFSYENNFAYCQLRKARPPKTFYARDPA
jgi:hypothetical protein